MRPASVVRLLGLAALWGSSFLWIKLALRGLSPIEIVFVRLALGAAVLTAILWARGLRLPSGRLTWGHLAVAAVFGNVVPYTLFGVGEQTVDSSVAGVLNATTPLWTLLLAVLAGSERHVTARRTGGLALGFAGTLLIFSPWNSASQIATWGGLACLLAALSYGISYVYMGRYLAGRVSSSLALSAGQLTAATGLTILATPFTGLPTLHLRADVVVSLAILGALGTGIAYVLNYRLITDEGPTAASTVTYLLPVVAVILGAAVLHEPITLAMVSGMALVLAGVYLSQRRVKRRARAEPAERPVDPPV